MEKKNRKISLSEDNVFRKRHKPLLKIENATNVKNISDLIKLSKDFKFYKNINTEMLWKITPHLQELESLIGMESLKQSVFYQIIYYLQGFHLKNKNDEYLHTVIMGPPGHGKTEVSKIIGKLYHAMDILSKDGQFKTAHREDFVAGYLGHTAIKTKKLLTSCLGGVLFIDEIYALAPRESDKDSFAKEAIDTITSFLSEHKNDFCCIIAGYEEDVKRYFFAMNKGLERRFPWVHVINQYSSKELADIFLKMVSDIKWKTDLSQMNISSIITDYKHFFKNGGGDIETFLGKCKMMHSERVFARPIEERFILTREDLLRAVEYIKKNNKPNIDEPPPGLYI